MKYITTLGLIGATLLCLGCNDSNSSSTPIEVNEPVDVNAPVTIYMKKKHLFSGASESAIIELSSALVQNRADEEHRVEFTTSDDSLISISPSECSLTSVEPRCEIQLSSHLEHEIQSSKDVHISATYKEDSHHLTTVTTLSNGVNERSFHVNNQCGFDVWLEANGASAAQIGCSPQSGTDFQSNCPDNQVCLQVNDTTNYCVNAVVIDINATAPIKVADENITYELNASACLGDIIIDRSSAVFGQCQCSTHNDCGAGQKCAPSAGTNQCQWDLELSNFGKVAQNANVNIPIVYPKDSKFAASGTMYIKLGCDESGANCLSDNVDTKLKSPTTFIEYTLATADVDFYDISNINGATIPVTIAPIVSKHTLFYSAENNGSLSFEGNPYWCSVAAGTSSEFKEQITKIKQAHPNAIPNTQLQDKFGCKNEYNATLDTGFIYVTQAEVNATHCTTNSDCNSSNAGPSCGVTSNVMLNNVDGNNTSQDNLDRSNYYQCGHIVGYASLTQLCGVADNNESLGYFDTALGINCSTQSDSTKEFTDYALCSMKFDQNDTGPARSCFNSNQTVKGDTCCGYSEWDGMPTGETKAGGNGAVSGVNTDAWTNNIKPFIKEMKEGCNTAYSYQYDDPYSTFTCLSKDSNDSKNYISYQVTLCDGNNSGGISIPSIKTCELDSNYPQSPANSLFVPAPGYTDELNSSKTDFFDVAVFACNDTSTCSESNLTAVTINSFANIYSDDNVSYFYVLGKDPRNETYQGCMFKAVENQCLAHAESTYNSIGCETWTLPESTNFAYSHRQVGMPAFSNGSDTNPFIVNPFK